MEVVAEAPMARLKLPVLLAVAGGLLLGLWAIGRAGLDGLARAVGGMGWGGFALYCLATLPMVGALGAAWATAMRPGVPRPLVRFAWARMLREAANELLPFSHVGGLMVGTRALAAAGLPPARVYAATIVDLTTEMAAQIVLTLGGLWVAGTIATAPGGRLRLAAWIGAAALVLMGAGLALLQRRALGAAARLAARVLPAASGMLVAVRAELVAFGARRGAMLPSFGWNLAAWLAAVGASWMALDLLGARLPVSHVFALETFIFALRSGAFFVPAGLGVQEVGYLLVAAFFGLSQEAALALSLVKRARELAFGLPALLAWQWGEWRGRG